MKINNIKYDKNSNVITATIKNNSDATLDGGLIAIIFDKSDIIGFATLSLTADYTGLKPNASISIEEDVWLENDTGNLKYTAIRIYDAGIWQHGKK